MSLSNKIKQQGFTIVELLIVIVVIGILAAITIVAYNGVQNRAKASSAKSAANTVIKKAEAYNADDTSPTTGYPVLPSQLANATASTLYGLAGSASFSDAATLPTTEPSKPSELLFYGCTNTGLQIAYWDYASTATNKWVTMSTGAPATCAYKRNTATS